MLVNLLEVAFIDSAAISVARLASSLELGSQTFQLLLVLAKQGLLVQVLVDAGLVLDLFGAGCKFKRAQRLVECFERGRDHGHHRGLAIAAEGIL